MADSAIVGGAEAWGGKSPRGWRRGGRTWDTQGSGSQEKHEKDETLRNISQYERVTGSARYGKREVRSKHFQALRRKVWAPRFTASTAET